MSELDKLELYLKEHGFNYERSDEDAVNVFGGIWIGEKHQIVVKDDKGEYLWDAICHPGSYGFRQGLLEIMGRIVYPGNDVEGYLTAQQIIDRLEKQGE